jgi:hypothetical protein
LFWASSKDLLNWECFAYKGMKQIGLIDGYRCGVMYRIECWLEALGIKYSIDPKIDKCMMHEKGACLGDIKVILGDWGSGHVKRLTLHNKWPKNRPF